MGRGRALNSDDAPVPTKRRRLNTGRGVASVQARRLAAGLLAEQSGLTDDQIRAGMRLDAAALAKLREITEARMPPRNALAWVQIQTLALAAIRTRLEYTQSKPAAKVEHEGLPPLTFRIDLSPPPALDVTPAPELPAKE